MTRTYSAGATGTDMKVTGVAADGTPVAQSTALTYEGKDCVLAGGTTYDTLSLTKVNGSTVKSTQKKSGQIVGHTIRTISAKGTSAGARWVYSRPRCQELLLLSRQSNRLLKD